MPCLGAYSSPAASVRARLLAAAVTHVDDGHVLVVLAQEIGDIPAEKKEGNKKKKKKEDRKKDNT